MRILEEILFEFPVSEVNIGLPQWIEDLDCDHWLRAKFEDAVHSAISEVKRLRDIDQSIQCLAAYDFVKDIVLDHMDLSNGVASIEMAAEDDLFYRVYQEVSGVEVTGLHDILANTKEFAFAKKEYDKLEHALYDVQEKGYGMVIPTMEEMILEEDVPSSVKILILPQTRFLSEKVQKKLLEMKNISEISKKIVNGINSELTPWPNG